MFVLNRIIFPLKQTHYRWVFYFKAIHLRQSFDTTHISSYHKMERFHPSSFHRNCDHVTMMVVCLYCYNIVLSWVEHEWHDRIAKMTRFKRCMNLRLYHIITYCGVTITWDAYYLDEGRYITCKQGYTLMTIVPETCHTIYAAIVLARYIHEFLGWGSYIHSVIICNEFHVMVSFWVRGNTLVINVRLPLTCIWS